MMNNPKSNVQSASYVFGTKAETLHSLSQVCTKGLFCEQTWFTHGDWVADQAQVLRQISQRFNQAKLVVRSSALREDSSDQSYAGAFTSVIDVSSEINELTAAIEEVFQSFGECLDGDQVLVQPMLDNVAISGVVMTRELDTGSPYYVINYDDYSGRTDSVTGGGESKSVLVHRTKTTEVRSERFRDLLEIVQEIESVTASDALDIEFCIQQDNSVFILQARPLAANSRWLRVEDGDIDAKIATARTKLKDHSQPNPGVVGNRFLFGVMPDWNPAEMIGTTPKPLALSLYKWLITDKIWVQARKSMGYRVLPDMPLLVDFAGHPFIDVRTSFNSFLPADLSDEIAEEVISAQLAILSDNREWHDKVEFEVALTCRDFDPDVQLGRMKAEGVSEQSLATLLDEITRVTNGILSGGAERIEDRLNRVQALEGIRKECAGSHDPQTTLKLLEACRAEGTLLFSELARDGFVAVSFLKSMLRQDILTEEEADRFMRSIDTVATEFVHDVYKLSSEAITQDDFLQSYGHLRPGTYDITSPRYDVAPELYLGHVHSAPAEREPFALSADQKDSINRACKENGIEMEADGLFRYMELAIRAREESKFIFTKCLSDGLEKIARWGEEKGLNREDLSFLSFELIQSNVSSEEFRQMVDEARHQHVLSRRIKLPSIISSLADVDVIRVPLGQPNFITHKSTTAPSVFLNGQSGIDLDGKIVLIEGADPGFDWIFSHEISGLITKYGGANSHMAIRCAEFGLPAAIGCGERIFSEFEKASVIALNCNNKTISKVS